jgi:hypothetical protein
LSNQSHFSITPFHCIPFSISALVSSCDLKIKGFVLPCFLQMMTGCC